MDSIETLNTLQVVVDTLKATESVKSFDAIEAILLSLHAVVRVASVSANLTSTSTDLTVEALNAVAVLGLSVSVTNAVGVAGVELVALSTDGAVVADLTSITVAGGAAVGADLTTVAGSVESEVAVVSTLETNLTVGSDALSIVDTVAAVATKSGGVAAVVVVALTVSVSVSSVDVSVSGTVSSASAVCATAEA